MFRLLFKGVKLAEFGIAAKLRVHYTESWSIRYKIDTVCLTQLIIFDSKKSQNIERFQTVQFCYKSDDK